VKPVDGAVSFTRSALSWKHPPLGTGPDVGHGCVETVTVGPDAGTNWTLVAKSNADASPLPVRGEIVMLLPAGPEWIERLVGCGMPAVNVNRSPEPVALVPAAVVTVTSTVGAVLGWPGVVTLMWLSSITVKHPFEDVPGGGQTFVLWTTVMPNWIDVTAEALPPLKKLVPVITTAVPPSLLAVEGETLTTVGAPAAAWAPLIAVPNRTNANALPNKTERDLNLIGENLSWPDVFRERSA
jgi:hypothetical protein